MAEVTEPRVWTSPGCAWKEVLGFWDAFAMPCSLLFLAAHETEAFSKQP